MTVGAGSLLTPAAFHDDKNDMEVVTRLRQTYGHSARLLLRTPAILAAPFCAVLIAELFGYRNGWLLLHDVVWERFDRLAPLHLYVVLVSLALNFTLVMARRLWTGESASLGATWRAFRFSFRSSWLATFALYLAWVYEQLAMLLVFKHGGFAAIQAANPILTIVYDVLAMLIFATFLISACDGMEAVPAFGRILAHVRAAPLTIAILVVTAFVEQTYVPWLVRYAAAIAYSQHINGTVLAVRVLRAAISAVVLGFEALVIAKICVDVQAGFTERDPPAGGEKLDRFTKLPVAA